MKLWDKGFSIDKRIEKFTVGKDREIDLHLAEYDVQASLAHAKMLCKIGILTNQELQTIAQVLKEVQESIKNGSFQIEAQFEDVHSKLEQVLVGALGEVGKKIHTARSRNDQVLVALHLYYKDFLSELKDKTEGLFHTLIHLAETYQDKSLPGYTHLQVAMPSSFGQWLSAYAELLIDDMYMLNAAQKVVDQNPLGSAAGYGSSFPIDRFHTTEQLGFKTLKFNSMAAQLSRGKAERTLTAAMGGLANTLSRFAMDICLYNSQNFNFLSFPQELTTGSSIMPHKKNPDVFELIRGKCNKIQAVYGEMLLLTNNLPSGYHRDFQLLKENMIQSCIDLLDVLVIFNYSIEKMIPQEIDCNDPKYKYLFTVDTINTLVENGVSFRDAYRQIGKQVQEGTYEPDTSKKHTHIGSIDNLGLEEITAKMKDAIME